MAGNITKQTDTRLRMTVGAGVISGDPVVKGKINGVALTDYDATDGKATVQRHCVAKISVKGIDGGGNSAVAEGDELFYVTGDTPPVSKKATGVHYGFALAPITSGATSSIEVLVD